MAYNMFPVCRTRLLAALDIEFSDEPVYRIKGDKLLLKRG